MIRCGGSSKRADQRCLFDDVEVTPPASTTVDAPEVPTLGATVMPRIILHATTAQGSLGHCLNEYQRANPDAFAQFLSPADDLPQADAQAVLDVTTNQTPANRLAPVSTHRVPEKQIRVKIADVDLDQRLFAPARYA